MRKCKVCARKYEPFNSLQKACSPECALAIAKIDIKKNDDKKWREKKKALNDTIPIQTKKTQQAFNEYIRVRDYNKPCVSCGKYEHELKHSNRGGLWDCGHYRSVGACPELRFEPLNAHKQCKKCNQFLSGNHIEYRFGIANRLTEEQLEWLEGAHEPKRYRVQELKEICTAFKAKTKELKALL